MIKVIPIYTEKDIYQLLAHLMKVAGLSHIEVILVLGYLRDIK